MIADIVIAFTATITKVVLDAQFTIYWVLFGFAFFFFSFCFRFQELS